MRSKSSSFLVILSGRAWPGELNGDKFVAGRFQAAGQFLSFLCTKARQADHPTPTVDVAGNVATLPRWKPHDHQFGSILPSPQAQCGIPPWCSPLLQSPILWQAPPRLLGRQLQRQQKRPESIALFFQPILWSNNAKEPADPILPAHGPQQHALFRWRAFLSWSNPRRCVTANLRLFLATKGNKSGRYERRQYSRFQPKPASVG